MMKVRVLVSSNEQMNNAGVRIRYKRLQEQLKRFQVHMSISAIGDFSDPAKLEDDVYLLSKCYDVRSAVFIQNAKDLGKAIGVDLFDDYFSQKEDSRLGRYRIWLNNSIQLMDFVLTSTQTMRENIQDYLLDVPTLVVDDPAPEINLNNLSCLVERKIAEVQREGSIKLAWFGIGDNPRFPVGLRDLTAFSPKLAELRDTGHKVKLEILTNRRAMTSDVLSALKRLPVPYSIGQWSESAQQALLERSHACFIPVNAQSFSIVKSLNRAVSAMVSGNQVISAGYPLYEPLTDFIYRDPKKLVQDLSANSPLLRADTIKMLSDLLDARASAEREADRLCTFFRDVLNKKSGSAGWSGTNDRTSSSRALIAMRSIRRLFSSNLGGEISDDAVRYGIIHGRDSPDRYYKFLRKAGTLSIGSPFQPAKSDFDVVFSFYKKTGYLRVFVETKVVERVDESIRKKLIAGGNIKGKSYSWLWIDELLSETVRPHDSSSFVQFMTYEYSMADLESALKRLFPEIECIISEHSLLPFYFSGCKRQKAAAIS